MNTETLNALTDILKKKGYTVSYFESAKDSADYVEHSVIGRTVGMGGSVTLDELSLYERLSKNNTVYWHQKCTDKNLAADIRKSAATADIYLSSVNALALTGEIVNIDGLCNRVSAMLYGHKKVYLVVGENKITSDCDSAIQRARNIAAPKNARRLGKKTPCAERADRCYNCSSPDRICKALSLLYEKPIGADVEIILVAESLGF